jgi:hypothetical protein
MTPVPTLRCVHVGYVVAFLIFGCNASIDSDSEPPDSEARADIQVEAQTAALTGGCTDASNGGREYLFCTAERSWSAAQVDCRAQGMELVRVSSSSENDYLKTHMSDESWIGASDSGTEGSWLWSNNSAQFWSGKSNGSTVGGLYQNWASGQPDDSGGTQDCASKRLAGASAWDDRTCSTLLDYICERQADLCPDDANKMSPGVCGCGVADVDANHDGVMDCTVGCTAADLSGRDYLFCKGERSWQAARVDCAQHGMRLARIDDSAENNFIKSKIVDESWIGANDLANEGKWLWDDGTPFWTGTANGSPVSGHYNNWA